MSFIKRYIKAHFSNFTYFYSILRTKIIIVILLSVAVGLLDSLGLTMFLPLLQMADGSNTAVDLGNLSFITNFLQSVGITLTIGKTLMFLLIIFLLKGMVVYYTSIYRLKSQQVLTKQVRMEIVNMFPVFSYQQFVKTNIGKINNIFLGEIGRLSSTYSSYISMIQGLVMVMVYMSFSFFVDWQFALLVCVGGLISNLIFNRINKLTKEKSKNISVVGNRFSNILSQYVNNFKYLKATGKIVDYRSKVEHSIDEVQKESLIMGELNAKVSSFREPLLVAIVVVVIFIQVQFFSSSISAILVSLLFFYRSLTSIVAVQNYYNNTLANQGAIDNIRSFSDELKAFAEPKGNILFTDLTHSIELKDVSLQYDQTTILDKVNLIIPKNKSIALVGESGSGKTTLVNLIIKLLQPNSGSLLVDGVNLVELNSFSYQKKIGYISQETTIFNDTIFNNVTFWDAPTAENKARFEQAIKKAAIFHFVDQLDNKSESILGNNGINLSGGQRQRISIARELYKNVSILVLDEATSALDSETEKEIQDSIDQLKGQLTIISIAHRLSTIKNADVIYLMDKGTIQASGSFDTLIQQSAQFSKMVQLQEI